MNSLFKTEDSSSIIERINKLSPGIKPGWGKMSVSQMMAHCTVPLRNALGEIKLKRSFMGIMFGSIAKKSVLKNKPFKQNLPTDDSFKIKDEPEFESARTALINYVQRFGTGGPSAITTEPHPFFGNMTPENWDALMYKHLDHHLRQFGV